MLAVSLVFEGTKNCALIIVTLFLILSVPKYCSPQGRAYWLVDRLTF